jgi:hypothetical protein
MRNLHLAAAAAVLLFASSTGMAATITGEYLEARTCDVYTGPCFANAEMGMAGKEAVLAWKVDEGSWNGTTLAGLSVGLVLKSDETLGEDGVFPMPVGRIRSVILIDENASEEQQAALVAFVKETAAAYTKDVRQIVRTPPLPWLPSGFGPTRAQEALAGRPHALFLDLPSRSGTASPRAPRADRQRIRQRAR